MIEPGFVRQMARYNAWQNAQLTEMLGDVSHDVLTKDKGAFFGSIFATLNHLLWGDMLWMNRFDSRVEPPSVGPEHHAELTPTLPAWAAERFRLDGRIRIWADELDAVDLKGNLAWYSGAMDRHMERPLAECVQHFFNHQTHHRGQVHAMMTSEGLIAPVSDLPFMPEDA